MKKHEYSSNVVMAIMNWYEENEGREITEEEIQELDPNLALELFLEWEGIIGYTHDILTIFNQDN